MPPARRLKDVPEAGVPISKLDLLLLGQAFQPVVSLPRRPGPVLVRAVKDPEDAEKDHADLSAEVDQMAGRVLRGIIGDVRPSFVGGQKVSWIFPKTLGGGGGKRGLRRNNSANGTEGNNITASYGLYGRSSGV